MKPVQDQLVSVIVPVHNGRETVAAAVGSALAQTHGNLEVVVVDDASSDGTWDVLGAIPDPRLRPLRQERNAGEGLSRNVAVAAARGDWVAMLDADDAWDPRRLELLLPRQHHVPGPVMIGDNVMHCYTVGGRLQPWRRQWRPARAPFADGCALLDLAGYLRLSPLLLKPLVPRQWLLDSGIVHSDRRFSADTEFHVRLLHAGLRLVLDERSFYLYRRGPGSMSDTPLRAAMMRDMFEGLLEQLEFTAEEAAAVRARIERLQFEDRYMPLLFDLKAGRWLKAARRGLSDPALLREFFSRLPDSARYRLSLWRHGGRSR